jgi:PilZ domain-containing protein
MATAPPISDFAPHGSPSTRAGIVIPVRYVAQGQVVHATSTAVGVDDADVRSVVVPKVGIPIALKLYFPHPGGILSRNAVVAETMGGQFRAAFDGNEVDRRRLSELLWRREMVNRPCPRFHTQLNATVRENGGPGCSAVVTNISRSGAFVKVDSLPARGSVVQLELALPGQAGPDCIHGYVVHIAERRGVGIQFVGAGDAVTAHLEEYLTQLERSAAAAGHPAAEP